MYKIGKVYIAMKSAGCHPRELTNATENGLKEAPVVSQLQVFQWLKNGPQKGHSEPMLLQKAKFKLKAVSERLP